MLRDHRGGDPVGHVGANQKVVVQVQQLHVQRHSLFPLQVGKAVIALPSDLLTARLSLVTMKNISPICLPNEFH